MHKQISKEAFVQDGLLPYHHKFFELFYAPQSPKSWLFAAPVGAAKTRLASRVVGWEVAYGDFVKVLVLSPAAVLRHWQDEISRSSPDISLKVIDRKAFLEIEACAESGGDIFRSCPVVLMSIDLAKRHDIRRSLLASNWKLVIFDESQLLSGQRLELLELMRDSGNVDRVLLLSNFPNVTLENVSLFDVSQDQIVGWDGTRLRQPVRRDVRLLDYVRTEEEIEVLRLVSKVGSGLREAFVSGSFQERLLLRSASSSTFSLESVLRRLMEGWRPVRNKLAHAVHVSAADLEIIYSKIDTTIDEITVNPDPEDDPLSDSHSFVAAFNAATQLLDSIDDIEVDSKLDALEKHLRTAFDAGTQFVCIFTAFKATAGYLESSLASLDRPCFSIDGGVDPTERLSVRDRFLSSGGVLVVTDVALEGMSLGFVDEVINYDLPESWLRAEQRWAQISRYEIDSAYEVLVMHDVSGSCESEREMLLQFVKEAPAIP